MNSKDKKPEIQEQEIVIDDVRETLIVALVEGELMGSVRLTYKDKRSASAHLMYVYQYYRRKGVGRLLIKACCELALDGGCETLGLLVSKTNKNAIGLYEACGLSFAYEYDDGMLLMIKNIQGGLE